jgi:hypothetical protein
MNTDTMDIKKCMIPEEVILQYRLSFIPDTDKILGIMGRYMYIELQGHLCVPDGDTDGIEEDGEVIDKTVVMKITISEFQKMFKRWIMGKKAICESYGHWCGAFGNLYVDEFEVAGYNILTRFDESKDCDDPGFVYYEEVPMIKVTKWSDLSPDFEHG